jgi:hypothetical protein
MQILSLGTEVLLYKGRFELIFRPWKYYFTLEGLEI